MASHKMILEKGELFSHFPGWQVGYSAFTYNISSKDNLIKYVENQRKHHEVLSYKEEVIHLLKEHSVDYIDEYLIT
jgi:putative transposase